MEPDFLDLVRLLYFQISDVSALTDQALRHMVEALALEEVARLEALQPYDDGDNLFENEARTLDTFPRCRSGLDKNTCTRLFGI